MGVWSNAKSFDKTTKDKFLRQAHPNVLLYRWIPNRQFFALTQPNERGSFFQPGSNTSDQNVPVDEIQRKFELDNPIPYTATGGTGLSQLRRTPPGLNYAKPAPAPQVGNPGVYLGATSAANWGASSGGATGGGHGRSSQL